MKRRLRPTAPRVLIWTAIAAAMSMLVAACAGAPPVLSDTPPVLSDTPPVLSDTPPGAPTAAPAATEPASAQLTAARDSVPLRMFGDTAPHDGAPVFFGMSNRLRDRADEAPVALRHAAEQAARFRRIAARYQFVTRSTAGSIGYVDDIVVDYDDADVLTLMEQLEVLHEEQDHEGSYILARAPGLSPAPPIGVGPGVGPGGGAEAPPWVSRPPILSGYLVAVGVVQRSSRLRESIDNADQDALKGLLTQARTTLRMIQEERSIDRVGTLAQVTAAQEARAVLQQFYIASRYASVDGRYLYSLAVGKE